MQNQIYLSLLNQTERIIKHYDEIAQMSGEKFNLFRIINLTSNEVRVHSALLADLLNPHGSHGQGAVFLNLFVKYLKLPNLDVENCEVLVEKYIGAINEDKTRGGQLDIFISDKKGNCIAIENKIYACDQENQLIRYHNYCKGWKNFTLLYLTLNGREATKKSCEGLEANEDYTTISYQTDIISWLESCRKECVTLPVVREGITHYINLIKLLTNQLGSPKMKNEVYKLITTTPEYFKAADDLANNINNAKSEIQWGFWEALRKKLEEKGLTIIDDEKIVTPEKIEKYQCEGRNNYPGLWIKLFDKEGITIHWGAEIETNFYMGFTIEYMGQGGISDQREFSNYRKMVLAANPEYFTDSTNWLGWKYSEPILNFREFNTEQMYKLADPEYLNETVSRIAAEAVEDINALEKLLNPGR